jgi:hypothetical protein
LARAALAQRLARAAITEQTAITLLLEVPFLQLVAVAADIIKTYPVQADSMALMADLVVGAVADLVLLPPAMADQQHPAKEMRVALQVLLLLVALLALAAGAQALLVGLHL